MDQHTLKYTRSTVQVDLMWRHFVLLNPPQVSHQSTGPNHLSIKSPPSLPNESSSVGHHSIRVIFILGYVVDEGEDELHPRLNQHHISYGGERGRREEQVRRKRRGDTGKKVRKKGREQGKKVGRTEGMRE